MRAVHRSVALLGSLRPLPRSPRTPRYRLVTYRPLPPPSPAALLLRRRLLGGHRTSLEPGTGKFTSSGFEPPTKFTSRGVVPPPPVAVATPR